VSQEVVVHARRVVDDPALADLLDDTERERAERRSSPARFITAHALLRTVVGERLGTAPTAVRFDRACATCGSHSHGKPVVAGHPEVFVSLSYSGDMAVVALTGVGEAGVDIEEVADTDFDGFATVTLAVEELPAMDAVTAEDLPLARARVWARKEAVLKATGHGLVVDPREVVVTGPLEKAELVEWRGDQPLPSPVRILDVDLGDPDHTAAVAVLTDQPIELRLVSD
jgi:4'-phosphopantetheinyl transferase